MHTAGVSKRERQCTVALVSTNLLLHTSRAHARMYATRQERQECLAEAWCSRVETDNTALEKHVGDRGGRPYKVTNKNWRPGGERLPALVFGTARSRFCGPARARERPRVGPADAAEKTCMKMTSSMPKWCRAGSGTASAILDQNPGSATWSPETRFLY